MKILTYTIATIALIFSLNFSYAQGPSHSNDTPMTSEQINNSLSRYYYYPNLQAYYDSETATYLFVVNGEWMEGSAIPSNYRGYAIKNDYRISLASYNGNTPFDMIEQHKTMFPADYSSKRKAPKTVVNSQIAAR